MLLLCALVFADPPKPSAGLYGGQFRTFGGNPLDTAWEAGGRVGVSLIPAFDLELELGYGRGDTQAGEKYELWSPRVGSVYHINPDQRVDVFLGVGFGDLAVRTLGQATNDLFMDAGPGLTIQLVGPLHLRADARWVGRFGSSTESQLEWNVGLDFRPELPPDIDGDGIKNKLDSCPEDPEDIDDFEDDDGCPDPDNDQDQVLDQSDECPNDKEDFDDFEDDDGCPDPDNDHDKIPDRRDKCPNQAEDYDQNNDEDGCPDNDNDGDGIADKKDGCPDDPEDMDGWEDDDGCPEADNDGDGIPDREDQCPDHPEDFDQFDDDDGCPDKDNDDDRIPDRDDRCPYDPETYNQVEDQDGCPDETPPEIKRFTGVIRGITFETGKAIIRPSSEPVLQEALAVFLQYPDLHMEIQGHTDDRGNDDANLLLSQARAESVMNWFIARGVDPGHLRAVGYGETQPIAENRSDAGRAENRRVEFRPFQPELPEP